MMTSGPSGKSQAKSVALVGFLLALFSATAFSTEGVLGKLVLQAGAAPPTVVAVRFALAAAGAWVFLALRRSKATDNKPENLAWSTHGIGLPRWPFWLLTLLGGVAFASTTVMLFLSFEYLPSGLTLTLLYTYPVLVALGSAIVGDERLTGRGLFAALLGFLGVAAVGSSSLNVENGFMLGVLFALVAALVNAAQLIWTNRLLRFHDPMEVTARYLTYGAAFLCVVVVIAVTIGAIEGPYSEASVGTTIVDQVSRVWARPVQLVALSLLPTLLAGIALLHAVKQIGAARTSLIATSEPPLAVVWGAIYLSEQFSPLQLAGTALIVGAILVLFLPNEK